VNAKRVSWEAASGFRGRDWREPLTDETKNEPAGAEARATISIVLVDDHEVIRGALRVLLDAEPDFEVVAEAGDAESGLRYVGGHKPDVLILDLNLPGISGLEAIPAILERSPETKIVILTMRDKLDYVREALQAGVHGYILKEAAEGDLVQAVRLASQGRRYVQPALGARMAAQPPDAAGDLSARETEVLRLIALGHTNQEIGDQLSLSVRTIESHRAKIHSKLDLSHRSELVRYAIENNLIDVESSPG
jgi:two-component system response regulator NreC